LLTKSRFIVWPSPKGGGFLYHFVIKKERGKKKKKEKKKKTPPLRYNIFIYIQNKLINTDVDK